MKNTSLVCLLTLLLSSVFLEAQITERKRPAGWEKIIYGGRFMDRFLPMPDLGGMTKSAWGAEVVIPRDTNNGIEDNEWSYWGGNARLWDDGKYHLFVCRWAENSPEGHMEWPKSYLVHAVADNSFGPYKVIKEIGKGHNPEWYITKDGQHVIYVIGGYYVADNINGPWKYNKYDFDKRNRKLIEGLSNLTFAKREDGSYIMICRGGGAWVSKTGLSSWNQITDSRVYPPVEGRFEDPLIWKTDVQYHLIVNDWLGRIAWYLRSKDGINWITDAGEAYLTGFSNYKDGTKEDWFKYERIRVMQDKFGRATQAHFAVIDTLKHEDLPNDNHSSKHIVIPLVVGKLISVLNEKPINNKTKEISLLIKAEEGFNPFTDIDFKSLRFGTTKQVNFGNGCKMKSFKKQGKDVLITFCGKGHGITNENFAAKLLGKNKDGTLLFGFTRLPGINYIEPILSARKPLLNLSNDELSVDIENFGIVGSKECSFDVFNINGKEKIKLGSGIIPSLEPYERKTINISTSNKIITEKDIKYLIKVSNQGEKGKILFEMK